MSEHKSSTTGNTCDLLAAYEMGLLADNERVEFEAHLAGCSECQEELFAMAPATVAMTSDPGAFTAAANKASAEGQPGLARRIMAWLGMSGSGRLLIPVAVAGVLALVMLWPNAEPGGSFGNLARVEPLPYVQLTVRSGGQGEAAQLFHKGMESYRQQRYTETARDLTEAGKLLADAPAGPETVLRDQINLYLGVSYLLADAAGEAVPPLRNARTSTLGPVADKAGWYLAQALLLQEQPDEALEVLADLTNSPVYGDKAAELIRSVEDLSENN